MAHTIHVFAAINTTYWDLRHDPLTILHLTYCYRWDGPWIESRWEPVFPHPSRPGVGTAPAPSTMGTWSFPGVKAARICRWPPTSIYAEVKERVQLHLRSPFGTSCCVIWRISSVIQGDSFGTRPKKMRISQRLFIRFWINFCNIFTYKYI
jgi:hypothetical protein